MLAAVSRSSAVCGGGRIGSGSKDGGRARSGPADVTSDVTSGSHPRPSSASICAEDVPELLDETLDLFSFDIDAVLHLLTTEFDVRTLHDGPVATAGVTRIRGTPSPDVLAAAIGDRRDPRADQDRPTNRPVGLRKGRPAAEVSFTFDRFGSQPDSAYQVSGHLGRGRPGDRPRSAVAPSS